MEPKYRFWPSTTCSGMAEELLTGAAPGVPLETAATLTELLLKCLVPVASVTSQWMLLPASASVVV